MKKLLITLAAALLIAPATLAARTGSVKTYFADERITGVSAEDFDVVLIKSNRTRAVVELSEEGLERFLHIGLDSLGVVSIDLKFMTMPEAREFNRLNRGNPVKKLTLYLPAVNTIRIQGHIALSTSDSFPGEDLDIMLANGAALKGSLRITSERAKVQFSGSSEVENLTLDQTMNLTLFGTSRARARIVAPRAEYSRFNISGGALLEIGGAGEVGNWSVGGSARIVAENFAVRILEIDGYGSSQSRVNVSRELTARLAGTASVRYRGEPRVINSYKSSKATSVSPL